jgi:hypothetical protein
LEAGTAREGQPTHDAASVLPFLRERKWISESPVSSDIKPPVGSSKAANKAPFTDNEINRIIAACDQVKIEWKERDRRGCLDWRRSKGLDLADALHGLPDF